MYFLTLFKRKRIIRDLINTVNSKNKNFIHKKVLFWGPGGMTGLLRISGTIITALRLRGADVHLIMCDGALSGCILREHHHQIPIDKWRQNCPGCKNLYRKEVESFDIPYSSIGDYVTSETRGMIRTIVETTAPEKMFDLKYKGIDVGRLAASSLMRYTKGMKIDNETEVMKEYLYSAMVATEAAISVFDRYRPDVMFTFQPFYVDYAPAMVWAINKKIPVIVFNGGYLSSCYFFKNVKDLVKNEPYALSDEGWKRRVKKPLTTRENHTLSKYLDMRFHKGFTPDIPRYEHFFSSKEIVKKYSIPSDKPIWCLFTHINWDVIYDYRPMAYNSVNEWIIESIKEMDKIDTITWIIKIHPTELTIGSEYSIKKLIEKQFGKLPKHIIVIPAEDKVNTYDLFPILNGGITIRGTIGLEMVVSGKPVILAGEAHYGGKGFTYDGISKKKYLAYLYSTYRIKELTKEQILLARRYAYSFFIQRQLPLNIFNKKELHLGILDESKFGLLAPGKNKIIDVICDKIINGGDFFIEKNDPLNI